MLPHMVAATGPAGSPPGATVQSKTILVLGDETPEGWEAFEIRLLAMMGPNLRATLKAAIADGSFSPANDKEEALWSHIHDVIVPCLVGHDKLLRKMSRKCGTNGPMAFQFLKTELDPDNTGTALSKLIAVINNPIMEGTVLESFDDIVAVSDSLPSNCIIPEPMMAALMITKLPKSVQSVRDAVVGQDDIPTIDALRTKLKNHLSFNPSTTSSARTASTNITKYNKTPSGPCFIQLWRTWLSLHPRVPEAACDVPGVRAWRRTHDAVLPDHERHRDPGVDPDREARLARPQAR